MMKNQPSQTPTRFDDLRQLLVGEEQQELARLQERLQKSEETLATLKEQLVKQETSFGKEIEAEKSRIRLLEAALDEHEGNAIARLAKDLAPALHHKEKQGPEASDELATAMEASTIAAIQKSSRQDKQPLTEALFPIMGPAIRNYVVDLFRGMAEELNQSIQNATSVERLRWRAQAKMAGKPYSEYVLLKTRSFAIEEVYLIQGGTGLLLLHAAKNPANEASDEADLVSGMFTAIRSFVKDSFSSDDPEGDQNEEELGRFTFGDREVLIEVGPSLVLAAVARGVPSSDARDNLKDILEQLHETLQPVLVDFSGDTTEAEGARPLLRQALIEQKPESSENEPEGLWRAWLALAIVGLIAATLTTLTVLEQARWNSFESALRKEAGVSISAIEKSGLIPRREVYGVRDPLAVEPAELAQEHEVNLRRTTFQFQLVQSLEEPFRTLRDEEQKLALRDKEGELLKKIEELKTKLEKSEQTQRTQIRRSTHSLIQSLFSDIPGLAIEVKEGAIRLGGQLSPSDLALVQSRIIPLQSFLTVDISGLSPDSAARLAEISKQIAGMSLTFEKGILDSRQESSLDQLAELLLDYQEIANQMEHDFKIEVLAHPLIGENRAANRLIEKERSLSVTRALTDKGLALDLLRPRLSEDLTKAGSGVSVIIASH
jgi:hypothetical protein